ncbi:11576_t:CDS:2 [Rhizophagus irregularis]|nr:11576_t:CDS:2 [Rhizophagus irregularis]
MPVMEKQVNITSISSRYLPFTLADTRCLLWRYPLSTMVPAIRSGGSTL